jgi:hypothetical protein
LFIDSLFSCPKLPTSDKDKSAALNRDDAARKWFSCCMEYPASLSSTAMSTLEPRPHSEFSRSIQSVKVLTLSFPFLSADEDWLPSVLNDRDDHPGGIEESR